MKETTDENETRQREKSLLRKPFWDKSKEKDSKLKL